MSLVAQFRAHPIATTLELGSVLVCCLLFFGTFVALATVPPSQSTTPWLAIVGVGAAFVLFWTAIVPLYERTR
ncbi:hypothetical protein ACFO5R_02055 [Halosolutus amylolyticus]|uniref:Uncharacterized protein n=1 Tax=Halosolutus amylolyticus TaxID=2932267 RepID=A0ABD5PJH5_9EURY|nr:hypothetical protein [Halosolutus amylolyticus]